MWLFPSPCQLPSLWVRMLQLPQYWPLHSPVQEPHNNRHPADNSIKLRESRGRSHRLSSHRHSSRSTSRARQSHRSHSHNSQRSISSSCSWSQDNNQRRSPQCGRCWSTGYRLQASHLLPSNSNSQANEGQLFTNRTPYKQGCKSFTVKSRPRSWCQHHTT